jgi:diphthine synthase
MGELVFVGLGLFDDKDLSLKAMDVATSADRVYAEFYTSGLFGARIEEIAARISQPVEVLDREDIEQDPERVLKEAEKGHVAFLTAGDPMAATTHVDLRLRAVERGIDTRVVHGASVFTGAFSELGLSVYKSGRTTTVEWPHGDYFPTSPYDVIRDNLLFGLHTLVLLDIRADEGRYMTASEGCGLLLRYEEVRTEGVLSRGTLACVVARAGGPDCIRRAAPLSELVTMEFGPPLHCIVIPGKLHFMESEALRLIAGADPFLLPSKDED